MSFERLLCCHHKKKLSVIDQENEGKFNRAEFSTQRDVVLPPVDSVSQVSIRRKIVLDQLSKA